MTVWNDATRSEHLSHATWMANIAVLMHLNERSTGDPARDWLSSWAHRWFVGDNLRVLVLGCGEGWLERAVAGWPFVARIDAVDFAEHAVARAREAGRGIAKIHYGVVDLNRDELPRDAYDVVVAHSVLHHVENLDHAYAQIERCMRPDATLVVNEYVGPNRFQYGDDVLSMINALLRALPEELRRPFDGGAPFEARTRPTVEEMIANDPTEAVRAEELVAFTEKYFDVRERKNIGGTILQFLLYDIVQNFRFDNPRERALLEMLCTIEAMLVDSGRLPCDFVLLAARKKGSRVKRANRPLPPHAEGAADIERDPLRRVGGAERVGGPERVGGRQSAVGSGTSGADSVQRGSEREPLNHHHLRLLRLALLSQQPHRANLFEESAFVSLRERFRARGHGAFDWLLANAPQDPVILGLLETAATLARA